MSQDISLSHLSTLASTTTIFMLATTVMVSDGAQRFILATATKNASSSESALEQFDQGEWTVCGEDMSGVIHCPMTDAPCITTSPTVCGSVHSTILTTEPASLGHHSSITRQHSASTSLSGMSSDATRYASAESIRSSSWHFHDSHCSRAGSLTIIFYLLTTSISKS